MNQKGHSKDHIEKYTKISHIKVIWIKNILKIGMRKKDIRKKDIQGIYKRKTCEMEEHIKSHTKKIYIRDIQRNI